MDCIGFPDRVLQRGLVTLDQLKVIVLDPGAGDSGVGAGGRRDRTGHACLARLFGWTMSRPRSFFAREWLEPRLVLYALTHLVAGPARSIWIALIGADGKHLPASVGWLALMGFLGAVNTGGRTQAARSRRYAANCVLHEVVRRTRR